MSEFFGQDCCCHLEEQLYGDDLNDQNASGAENKHHPSFVDLDKYDTKMP